MTKIYLIALLAAGLMTACSQTDPTESTPATPDLENKLNELRLELEAEQKREYGFPVFPQTVHMWELSYSAYYDDPCEDGWKSRGITTFSSANVQELRGYFPEADSVRLYFLRNQANGNQGLAMVNIVNGEDAYREDQKDYLVSVLGKGQLFTILDTAMIYAKNWRQYITSHPYMPFVEVYAYTMPWENVESLLQGDIAANIDTLYASFTLHGVSPAETEYYQLPRASSEEQGYMVHSIVLYSSLPGTRISQKSGDLPSENTEEDYYFNWTAPCPPFCKSRTGLLGD
jgi:hypothetical protein